MQPLFLARLLTLRFQSRCRQRWTRAAVEQFQVRQLARLRMFVYQNSPFYRKFHSGLLQAPLSELPILTKSEVMENFDELTTDRSLCLADLDRYLASTATSEPFKGKYHVCATSGSSGARGVFVMNRREWLTSLSSFDRGLGYTHPHLSPFRRTRIASVTSTAPWHMSFQVMAATRNPWVATANLDASTPLEILVERLNEFQPDILLAYPSAGRMLAQARDCGRLRISPTTLLSGSEVLNAAVRQHMERAFGGKVFDQYGVSEIGNLASECEQHSGLHANEDLAILEAVDSEGRPVAPGEFGHRLLLTVLFRYTQPLIRYELDDMIRIAPGPCPCGRQFALIIGIQGRSNETVQVACQDGRIVKIHPLVLERVLDLLPATRWQLQTEGTILVVFIAGLPLEISEAQVVNKIESALATIGVTRPQFVVRRVEHLQRGLSSKLGHVAPTRPEIRGT